MTNYFDNFETITLGANKVISGWVAPDGTFEDCLYGEHSEMAFEIIKEKGWVDEWRTSRHNHICKYSRDFLIHTKNYVLLDCPTCNDKDQSITFNPLLRHPKAQVNTLLKLFEDQPVIHNSILLFTTL